LFSRTSSTQFVPAAFPFAVPLMSDTPESFDTPKSSIAHTLTATVYSSINEGQSFSKSIVVQPRRYTAHALTLRPSPLTKKLDSPTPVEVQIPRTKFQAGEQIPVYVTIPPPKRELVVEQGVRLRSIRAELVRVIKVKDQEASEPSSGFDFETDEEDGEAKGPPRATTSTATGIASANKSTKAVNRSARGWTTKTVVTRSGAGCRFHAARPIRQRLILHQPLEPPHVEPAQMYSHPHRPNQDPDPELGFPLISQTTVLHCVTFRLMVYITFINMSHHTEHVETVVIPLTIIPPPAPLPEADADLDAAYRKKHDKPPQRTVRGDDSDNTPHYEEAGPSYAPPPFDERDAPPPFQEPSSSNLTSLPTFLEAEGTTYASTQIENEKVDGHSRELVFPGEGVQFGFAVTDQFDGHTVELEDRGRRSTTPPPTMEMANRDPDVTDLASMDQQELAMEALGLALERHGEEGSLGALPTLTAMATLTEGDQPPPLPPTLVMDDPSDPPPSIDSDYSDARGMAHQPPPPPPPPSLGVQPAPHDATIRTPVDGHAPPPYLVPDSHHDGAGPPPYIEY
jgi:neural Wiskott-Aldrich syndrome protein